jgi:hypothetical protein
MPIETYAQFWPFYLSQHRSAATRNVHFIGTSCFIALIIVAAITRSGWPLLLAVLMFYIPAWFAHFLIEGNRPASWRYPSWSFISDVRMLLLWLRGGLSAEIARLDNLPMTSANLKRAAERDTPARRINDR